MSPSRTSRKQAATARLRHGRERARAEFLAKATAFFRATDDEQRDEIRRRVLEDEIKSLVEAARDAARGVRVTG